MFIYSYDPELDLWAIICPAGYTETWETFKYVAVIKCRMLNKELALKQKDN